MQKEQTNVAEQTIAETENQQPAAEKRPASGQEILAAIREMAERMGRYPSMPELTQAHPEIKIGTVRKYFAGYGEALREAGFEGGGCGYTVTMDALFRDWARLARKFGRCPTMSEYERDSKYSVRPLVGRFRVWSQVPRGLYGYAEREELDIEFGDVMEMIQLHYGEKLSPQRAQRNTEENKTLPLINTDSTDQKEQWADGNWQSAKPNTFETRRNGVSGGMPTEQTLPLIHGRPGQVNTESTDQKEQSAGGKPSMLNASRLDPRRWEAREMRQRRVPVLPDRPIYGPPMVTGPLACGPTNENGVIYLFGSLALQLGFVVMKVQTEFPDCEALRHIGDNRWQHVRIEFEYESRNFLKHMHDPKGCDAIVCWEDNWRECPVEVIELSEVVKQLG